MFSLFKGKRRELFFMCFVIIADFIEYTVFISCDIQRWSESFVKMEFVSVKCLLPAAFSTVWFFDYEFFFHIQTVVESVPRQSEKKYCCQKRETTAACS